ncbi:MAG: hypothetical protein ABIF17_04770 [Patescibacteria group bacterium]
MSSAHSFYKKIILFVAVLALIIVIFVFFIDKAVFWQVDKSNTKINTLSGQDVKALVIGNNNDIIELSAQMEGLKNNSDAELLVLTGILDRFVLTGKNLNKIFVNYKQRGVDISEYQTQLAEYYSFVESGIETLNKLEWKQNYEGIGFRLYNHDTLKQKMFTDLQSALENLKNIFTGFEEIIVISSDKPFQCGLADTKAVYSCEKNYRKVILSGGEDFYDIQGQKVDNCDCAEIKCFENINLCQ